MAVVLVYADWCGHCQTFKNKVWNENTLNRTKNLNTASVHYDMVDQTSMKNTPIQGYPSMFLVGKDNKPKEIPTPQNSEELISLDEKSTNIGNNENINTVKNTNNNNNNNNRNNDNVNANNNNKPFNSESPNMNSYTPSPPNALNDVMNTPETNETAQRGGSLMDLLSSFSQGKVDVPEQQGGRRKTRRHRRNRRAQTRRR